MWCICQYFQIVAIFFAVSSDEHEEEKRNDGLLSQENRNNQENKDELGRYQIFSLFQDMNYN